MHSLLNKVFMSPESLSMVLSNLKEILSHYLSISFKAEFFFFFNESVKGCHGNNNDGLVSGQAQEHSGFTVQGAVA